MINNVCKRLTLPVQVLLCLIKYHGIWGLKRLLFESESPDARLIEIYGASFSRYGSWIGYDSQFAGQPCFPQRKRFSDPSGQGDLLFRYHGYGQALPGDYALGLSSGAATRRRIRFYFLSESTVLAN